MTSKKQTLEHYSRLVKKLKVTKMALSIRLIVSPSGLVKHCYCGSTSISSQRKNGGISNSKHLSTSVIVNNKDLTGQVENDILSPKELMESKDLNKSVKVILSNDFYSRLYDRNRKLYERAKRTGDFELNVEYFDSLALKVGTTSGNNCLHKQNSYDQGINLSSESIKNNGTINNNGKLVVDAKSASIDEQASNVPTILLLHGSPGVYKDYRELISFLVKRNEYRIIAPNFPRFDCFYKFGFRYTAAEKLEYLLNFFSALKIKQFDCVVGHSSAILPILNWLDILMIEQDANCKHRASIGSITYPMDSQFDRFSSKFVKLRQQSLAQPFNGEPIYSKKAPGIKMVASFSSPFYELPPVSCTSFFRSRMLAGFDHDYLRPVLVKVMASVTRMLGIVNDCDTYESMMTAAASVWMVDDGLVREQTDAVVRHKLPLFMLTSERDKLLPQPYFTKLLACMGLDIKRDAKHYDKVGNLVHVPTRYNQLATSSNMQLQDKSQKLSSFQQQQQQQQASCFKAKADKTIDTNPAAVGGGSSIWASNFISGGHYVFQRMPKQVNEDLLEFIKYNARMPFIGQQTTLTTAKEEGKLQEGRQQEQEQELEEQQQQQIRQQRPQQQHQQPQNHNHQYQHHSYQKQQQQQSAHRQQQQSQPIVEVEYKRRRRAEGGR